MPGKPALTRQRIKGAFLEALATYGNLWRACEVTGMPRSTVYYLQEHDEAFAQAYNVAQAIATERLEEEARRRAVEGVEQRKPVFYLGQPIGEVVTREYSDSLLMFLLKARAPERYRERLDVTQTQLIKSYEGIDVDAV